MWPCSIWKQSISADQRFWHIRIPTKYPSTVFLEWKTSAKHSEIHVNDCTVYILCIINHFTTLSMPNQWAPKIHENFKEQLKKISYWENSVLVNLDKNVLLDEFLLFRIIRVIIGLFSHLKATWYRIKKIHLLFKKWHQFWSKRRYKHWVIFLFLNNNGREKLRVSLLLEYN